MEKLFKSVLTFAGLCGLASSGLSAQTLVSFNDGNLASTAVNTIYASSTNLTTSHSFQENAARATLTPVTVSDKSSALGAGTFFSFTVTADPMWDLTLNTFQFETGKAQPGVDFTSLEWSTDGFSSVAGSVDIGVSGRAIRDYDLGGAMLSGGDSLNFRLIAWNVDPATTNGELRVFSGALQGTVTAVPEPSTYAAILGGMVLAGVALRRRRRQVS